MSDIDVFAIEDDFDPLADLSLDNGEDQPEYDYLPPIPDAELSHVPEKVPLTAQERIEKLLVGIPGQTFRILGAVKLCTTPRELDEVVVELDEAFPATTSVYGAAQIVQLLEQAGALECLKNQHDEMADEVANADDEGFIAVTPALPKRYAATRDGLDAVARHMGEHMVFDLLEAQQRYVPLYQRILEMTAREGGCPVKELDAAIDVDPLCEEPRRFCGYFLGKLEAVGAVQWRGNWTVTDLGARVLASDLFN